MPHTPFSSKDDLNKGFWENIHFGRVVVWYGVNRMIIHFSKPPFHQVAFSSFHPFLHTHPGENIYSAARGLNQFRPPNSSDDLCFLFCLCTSSMINNQQCLREVGVFSEGMTSTAENLAIFIWDRLVDTIPPPAKLYEVHEH